jgi:diguanylate cyclase (GGDEF)-like protein
MSVRSDRWRVVVILLVIFFLGSAATNSVSYVVSRDAIRAGIRDSQLPLTGDSIYSNIQRDILRPIHISEQMAADSFLLAWVRSGEQDPAVVVQYLSQIQEQFDATTAFFVSEATRSYYHPRGVVESVSERDPADGWYFRVRQITDPYEINFDSDAANGDSMTAFINYRVLDGEGNFVGVTGVGIELDTLRAMLDSYGDGEARRVSFVDAQGQLKLAGDAVTGLPIGEQPGIGAIAKRILGGTTEQRLSYELDGRTVLVNSRFVEELGWYLIVEQDDRASVQPLRATLIWNLTVGALITAVVLGCALVAVQRHQRRLEHAASTDGLTGIANRLAGEARLVAALSEAERKQRPVSVLILDLDQFKLINDEHGHPVGDRVIRSVATVADASVRSTDRVIRWGGEEFLIVLRSCALADAEMLAERIRQRIETEHFRSADLPPVTVSIGVGEWMTGEGREALIARVDAALYRAKRLGRNRIEIDKRYVVESSLAGVGISVDRQNLDGSE